MQHNRSPSGAIHTASIFFRTQGQLAEYERAAHDDHPAVRPAAVQKLALGWKDNPEVQAFLENLASAKSR